MILKKIKTPFLTLLVGLILASSPTSYGFYQADQSVQVNAKRISKSCQQEQLTQEVKDLCYEAAVKTYRRYLEVLGPTVPTLETYIQPQYSRFVLIFVHSYTMRPKDTLDGADHAFNKGATGLFVSLQGHRNDGVRLRDIKGKEWIEDTGLITDIAQGFGDKIILSGFSLGGILSIQQANARPHMVDGYMAMAPSFHGGPMLPYSEKSCLARVAPVRGALETFTGENLSNDFVLGGCAIFRVSKEVAQNIQTRSFRNGDWNGPYFENNYRAARRQMKNLTMPGVIIHSEADQVVSHTVNEVVTSLLSDIAPQNFIHKKYGQSGPRHWGDHIYYSSSLEFSGYDGLDYLFEKLSRLKREKIKMKRPSAKHKQVSETRWKFLENGSNR